MSRLSLAALALSAISGSIASALPSLEARQANAQQSFALDPSQIQSNLASDGQGAQTEAGQVRSLTSENNFINFCLTQKVPLTNGLQVKTGSCNPTIMGRIMATDKFVSSKFVFPPNGGIIEHNQTFTIKMNIKNMQTGNFVNPQTNYYAAPCQVNEQGLIIGHSHVVVEQMSSINQEEPPNPNVFAFFKGLNGVAAGGALTAEVPGGLSPGIYRMCSINACANHQPVLGAVAQHGNFDDCVYFESRPGAPPAGQQQAAAAAPPPATAAPAKGAAPPAKGAAPPAKGAAPPAKGAAPAKGGKPAPPPAKGGKPAAPPAKGGKPAPPPAKGGNKGGKKQGGQRPKPGGQRPGVKKGRGGKRN